MRHILIILTALLCASPAMARNKVQKEQGSSSWKFKVSWKDHRGKKQNLEYRLVSKTVERDLDKSLKFKPAAMTHRIIQAINAYGKDYKGASFTAKKDKGGFKLVNPKGKNIKKAVAGIPKVRDKAQATFMRRNGWTLLDGKIIPNHAAHAARYADDVLPLAKALGADSLSKRAFAERAIGFVQEIPYEIGKEGRDKGFRRPLSVLARNRGDCDSKATLYLALLKAAHPDLQSGFVYIKGHAYVGLGIAPKKGDLVFEADGAKWVIAEPVGPALVAVGKAGPKSERKAKRGRIEFRRTRRPEGL